MQQAGKEERRLAIDNGDVDGNGIPYITVLLDGGWSKRSYGHSYNASSGVVRVLLINYFFQFLTFTFGRLSLLGNALANCYL